MGHWPKFHGGKPLQPRNAPPPGSQQRKSRCPPRNHNNCQGWSNKTDTIDVSEDHSPQDEIALHYIQPNATVQNTHPKEIMVRDVCAPQCNEAYTTIQLPASASRKGTALLCIKVNTRARGNVLPFCVFWHLYPDQISPAGLPTGLDHISARLTAYNGSHILLYGALHGPITWQPDCPCSWPHRVNSYWYITDTPGPVILGLPSSKKLAVVKINCAIMVRQPGTHPAPVSTTAATTKPATAPEAAKSIRSTNDLIKEFLDWFKGIGRFPSKYKIQFHHDAHPVIHAPRKCPHCLMSKGQGAPWQDGMPRHDHPCRWNQWTGYPPLPTFRRQMVSYVCAWIPVISTRPSATITTRCLLWRKLLMSLHTLASSLS